MNCPSQPARPPAWMILERALTDRRAVAARYHGHERVVCPHALGWKNGRAKLLAYQCDGTTSDGTLPADPRQRWRSMFIDEIEHLTIVDGPWHSAENHSATSNGIDELELSIKSTRTEP